MIAASVTASNPGTNLLAHFKLSFILQVSFEATVYNFIVLAADDEVTRCQGQK